MATRKIETELKLTGEKQFNDQMKAINNGLKTTKSDMAALSVEFDDNANSVEALTAKQKLLQSSVEQHKAKVAALKAQYEAAAASMGENEATTQRYKQQLNAATVTLNKETAALERNAEALKKAKKEDYTPVTQRMAKAVKEATNNAKESASTFAHHTPVIAEFFDVAKVGAKGLGVAANGAKVAVKGLGTVTGGVAKGVGGFAKGIGAVSAAAAAPAWRLSVPAA